MSEPEFDIDAALINLLRGEERKQPSRFRSVEPERYDLLLAFNDHIAATSALPTEMTIEDFLNPVPMDSDDFDEMRQNRQDLLTELIRADVENYPVLTEGEMRVSGDGFYHFESEESLVDGESLDGDEAIHGYIGGYTVLPMISPEKLERMQDESYDPELDVRSPFDEVDAIWVTLNDAVVYDNSGYEIGRHDMVLVPFSFPTLKFRRVLRQATDIDSGEKPARELAINEFAFGLESRERCVQIENDLNFNDYSDEERDQRVISHQDDLNGHTASIDRSQELLLTFYDQLDLSGRTKFYEGKKVRYVQSLVSDQITSWRVVHCFEAATEEGAPEMFIHVLPEHLVKVEPAKE